MCEEGDESASFEIQLIRLDIFSVGGFNRNFVMKLLRLWLFLEELSRLQKTSRGAWARAGPGERVR